MNKKPYLKPVSSVLTLAYECQLLGGSGAAGGPSANFMENPDAEE